MKCLSLVCVKLFLGNLFEISYSGKTRVFFKKEECEEDGLERERVRRPEDLQFFNSPWQNSFLMVLLIGQIPQQTNSYRGPQRTLVARTLAWLIGTHEPSQRSLLMGPRWPWTKPVNGQCPPRSQDHKVRWTFRLGKLPLLTPPPPPPPPCVHAWHVVGLLNLAVKKTHAKRKPLELQYPECFMEGSWLEVVQLGLGLSALELVYRL